MTVRHQAHAADRRTGCPARHRTRTARIQAPVRPRTHAAGRLTRLATLSPPHNASTISHSLTWTGTPKIGV